MYEEELWFLSSDPDYGTAVKVLKELFDFECNSGFRVRHCGDGTEVYTFCPRHKFETTTSAFIKAWEKAKLDSESESKVA